MESHPVDQIFEYCQISHRKVFNVAFMRVFCFVWVTFFTEVAKDNIHLKIVWQYFAFIFPNVFRRQLHFPGNYVIVILNKGCVKHNSANCSAAGVSENYFCIPPHREGHFLFFIQIHNNPPFMLLLFVSLARSVTVNKLDIHAVAVVNIKTGVTSPV